MLISIIVPVFNTEPFLKRCLNSILSQEYENVEIVLVDDGSQDGSGLICDQYATEYSNIVVVHQNNAGLSIARNNGIKVSKGNFLMFVDSDDELENPHLISDNIGLFDNNTDFLQYPIRKIFVVENRTEILCSCTKAINTQQEYLENILPLYKNNLINGSVCNKIFRRQVFDKVMFREGILHEDSTFILDISDKFYNVKLSNIGYYDYYIRGGGSINTTRHSFKWYSDFLNMQLRYYENSSISVLFEDVKINNYIALINTLRMAYKDLKKKELNDLVKRVENSKPQFGDLFKHLKKNPFQCFKLCFAHIFGLKLLLMLLTN